MTKLMIALQNMINESEEGQGLAEYGLILALAAVSPLSASWLSPPSAPASRVP